jgi:hypothetical protein
MLSSLPLLVLARESVFRSGCSPVFLIVIILTITFYCTGMELENLGQNTITGKQNVRCNFSTEMNTSEM